MPTTTTLIEVKNETDRPLQVFQSTTEIQEVAGNATRTMDPKLPVKVCSSAEAYVEHEDEFQNPFFCIRDAEHSTTSWMRIFDSNGSGSVRFIHHSDNRYESQQRVISRTVNDGRVAGLYLRVYWIETPGEGRVLWIVGEMVTDVAGGGDPED